METSQNRTSWLDRPVAALLNADWETLVFALILILAVLSRFYNLEPRVMSHDENSHVYYSWRLYKGDGYQHTPITHGPLLFHITAFSYFLFGDSDTSARIPYALFGFAAVAFIWAYRRYLGRAGTLIAAGLMLISPYMLYYSRYVRNEAFIMLFGVITIWAVLRYLETGKDKYTYWLTAATVLHFTAKETSFIYTAQVLLFLGLLFVYQVTQQKWERKSDRTAFIGSLIAAFSFLALAIGVKALAASATAPVEGEISSSGTPVIFTVLPAALSGVSLLVALFFVVRGYTWERLRKNRPFGLILLLVTLILPHMVAFPVQLTGWDPLDYSTAGIIRTAIFLVPIGLLAIGIGIFWDKRLWLINAAIFYIPFTLLYTTFFTNGTGFFSGLVGSLGYWLEQQGVQRGSQPWYYYTLLQVPVYEFLTALGTWVTVGILIARKVSGTPLVSDSPETGEDSAPKGESQPQGQLLYLLLTGFWLVTSTVAYTIAGEKMPWLTVHIALPLILFSGWGFGQLVEGLNWKAIRSQRGLLMVLLILVFLVSLSAALGSLLSPNHPFSGKGLNQLNSTLRFVFGLLTAIGSGAAIAWLLKGWDDLAMLGRLGLTVFFGILAVLTARAAYRAAYINYDNPTEYLVYAHSATGVKRALAQIQELSERTTDGLDMLVAYDDETTYPYWWYLRNYTNQRYYAASPTRDLRDAPAILVGDNNYAKIEPVVGQAYYEFDYNRIWWPNQDYYDLTWGRIVNALTNPEMRAALWEIWLNRDYTKYAEVTGSTTLTLPTWDPADRMRLYIRKDVAAQVWNLGAAPSTDTEEIFADPYEGKGVILLADESLGGEGVFNLPRNLAVAPDGTLYVADTGSHRILHITADGKLLHSWGSFADSAATEGGAPPGTFYEPWSVAIADDGSVFVADTWNHRIQKFTSDGRFLTQWGIFGQAETPDAFWGPRDIAIDKDGLLYITDTGNKRVAIFDQDGNFINQFGSAGLLTGQFDEPVGIAVDAEGRVYVADTWNQRVQVFEYDAEIGQYAPVNEWPIAGWYGQSLDNKPYLRVSGDRVYVSDPEGYRILEFTTDGGFIRYWGQYGSDLSSFILPTGLAVDSEGGLWVADAGNNRLMHFQTENSE